MVWGVAPDKYPYPDKKICEPLNRDLHYAIVHGELEGIAHPQKRHDRTRLQPLWAWLIKPERKDDPRWKPLRDFCQRWEKVRGETLADAKGKHEEPQSSRGRGRPGLYKWDDFQVEITRIANTPDGLPEMQADLEKEMAQWCEDTWGVQPGVSTIRGKIAPHYQRDRQGQ